MRVLFAAIVLAVLGWSGFWWLGARAVDRELTAWFDQRGDSGWVAFVSDVTTRGFPNRFDTTLTDIDVADPETGLAWTAPFLQVFRLSYQPRHMIVVWPNTQSLANPTERISVTSQDMRGSFVFGGGERWPVDRTTLTIAGLRFESNAGWDAKAEQVRVATRPSERLPGAVDLGFAVENMSASGTMIARLAELDFLPDQIERIDLDVSVRFDRVWDRGALEDSRPQPTEIRLHRAQIRWGQLEIWAAGDLNVNDIGRPTGSVMLKLRNWRDLLALAEASGWMPDRLLRPLTRGLELLAGLAGSQQALDVPLDITDGRVRLGPVPLGVLPPFVIR